MITLVYGSRPEALKLGPVAAELKALRAPFNVICTGQHTDLLKGTPAESDLSGGRNLGFASAGDVLRWLYRVEGALFQALSSTSLVVVQGDTMSALAGARAAAKGNLLLAHVEAGVRSHNLTEPWPEEGFRTEITQLASWHYAPTANCFANLLAEGVRAERVRVTGNTVVSALARYTGASPQPPQSHLFVTLHRREWLQGKHFFEVLDAFGESATERPLIQFVWPMHPNILKRLSAKWLGSVPHNFRIIPALPYRDSIAVLSSAFGAITDSGGVAEEAATLGVPAIHLRNITDRPEAIEAGVARWEPPTREGVLNAVAIMAAGSIARRPSDCFGDITSASQVARHLTSLDLSTEQE